MSEQDERNAVIGLAANPVAGDESRLYAMLINATQDFLFLKDHEFRYLFVNEANARFFGRSAAEVIGRDDFELMSAQAAQGCRRTDETVLQLGAPLISTEEVGGRVYETQKFPVPLPDGSTGVGGYVRDITSTIEWMQKLRDSEEQFHDMSSKLNESQRQLYLLLNHLPGMAYRCKNDPQWTIEFVSEGSLNLTGYPAERFMPPDGLSYAAVIHPEDRQQVWDSVQEQLAVGNTYRLTYRIVTADGQEKWVWESGQAMLDEAGQVLALEGFIFDITERVQAEMALRRIEWMLSPQQTYFADAQPTQPYGDLTVFNTQHGILHAVGKKMLHRITREYIDLLGTSSAIYERTGEYAFGIFSSGWCRCLDAASFQLCQTADLPTALASGRWLCHESCWKQASLRAIEQGEPVDVPCEGGIRLYAVPIWAHGEIIGAINFGYGDPPTDRNALRELSEKYQVSVEELQAQAKRYESRPPYIIELAKRRLQASALLIGEIVERKQAEDAVQESQKRYRQLYESLLDGFVVVDMQGRILAFNEPYCQMLGYSPEELYQLTYMDLTPSKWHEFEEKIVETQVLPRGYSDLYEKEYRRKDGTIFPVELRTILIRDADGRAEAMSAIVRDISERRAAQQAMQDLLRRAEESQAALAVLVEEQRRAHQQIQALNAELEQRVQDRTAQLAAANKELEAFAYSISHDLRAPLRAMDGFSVALLNRYAGVLDEQGQHYLKRIREASVRMAQLIEDLLNLSRISRFDFNRQMVDLSALAHQIADDLTAQFPRRTVVFQIQPHLVVNADEHLLKIALQNLLDNAFKFTAQQQQAFIVVGGEKQADEMVYYVRDNGAGFDMQYADKLFAPFQRLHTQSEFPGTGIGLVTVQRIIHRHGGRIWPDAAPGHGATFYFTLGSSYGTKENLAG
jgi:PAS domain S-box-containing protein